MTTRKLHDRAREHVLSASKRNNNTALGDHYRERHNEKEQQTKKSSKKSKKSSGNESDKMKFKESPKSTIKHQPDLLRLHIEEATAIKQLKPTLNRRQETLCTGFLPYFFPSLFARFLFIHLYIFIMLTFTCTLHTSLLLTLPLILHLYLLRT